jgi:hypothetical protein
MAEPAETPDVAGCDELEERRQRRRAAPVDPVPGCAVAAAAEVIPILAWRSRSEQRARLLNRIQEMLRPD